MPIDSDFHSHVSYTSPLAMARAAQFAGLRVLGLSEHTSQMHELLPLLGHLHKEGAYLSLASYAEAVREAAEQEAFDLRAGLEVDFIPQKNAAIQAAIRGYHWDFLIGSVHEIDERLFESSDTWTPEEGRQSWLRYFELLRAAVNSGYFDVVSHPVRMRRTNPYLPETFDAELERLASEAARRNVALEINGYDVLHYPEAVQRLALACARQGTPISVGSDAHYPMHVAGAHAQTAEILRNAGINRVRTWKQRTIEEYVTQ